MKTKLNLLLTTTLIFGFLSLTEKSNAQDATAALLTALGGAGGYAIGKAFEKEWQHAPIAGAAILPMIANWGYNAFKKKSDEEKIKYYISGRNYERWLQSQKIWYQSTLDPYTGRPQAFSGLEAMDDGIPEQFKQKSAKEDIAHVFTIPVRLPAGTYNGVPYTERIAAFPKLP